jgi:ligand-binding sensor protein
VSNQDSLSEALSDILDTLAGVSQGAFRLIGPQGTIVAQAGTDAENCRLIRSCHGSDYCRRNCWQGARASLSGIIECASKAVQIVIPLTFGGQFLGNLYCGDFRLADHSELCQDESVWKGIAEGLKLDPKRLIEAHCALRVKTRTELEQLQQNLRKLLEDQILDKLLELRIKEVKTYIVKLDEVPRGELWHGIEDEVRLLARVGTFEIFTVASGRDAITRECPPVETWDGKERYQDFEQAAARGYYTDADNRLVIALQYEDRLLAFMRVSSVQLGGFQSGDRDSERLRKLGDAIAEALSLRRHQRAEKMMGELYKELQGLQDHRERLRIILIKCLKLLDCQHGEVLLRKPSDPMRLEVVVRHGIAEELLPLPSYTSGTQGLLRGS